MKEEMKVKWLHHSAWAHAHDYGRKKKEKCELDKRIGHSQKMNSMDTIWAKSQLRGYCQLGQGNIWNKAGTNDADLAIRVSRSV